MILCDVNQVMLSALFADPAISAQELDENLLRHFILNSLRSYRRKFKAEYGEMILCYDGRNIWRKEEFPNYKITRKKLRKESKHDWNKIFALLTKIQQEFVEHIPYKVMYIDNAEADDIIATMVEYYQTNEVVVGPLFDDPKPVLIISSDKDFKQLQKYDNVRQYSPLHKKFLTENRPDLFLKEHIIRGDQSDSIPNIRSPDNSYAVGTRCKPISEEKLALWIAEDKPENFCDDRMLVRYYQNKKLIDMSEIPQSLKDKIIEQHKTTKAAPRNKLLNYLIANRLKLLIDCLEDF